MRIRSGRNVKKSLVGMGMAMAEIEKGNKTEEGQPLVNMELHHQVSIGTAKVLGRNQRRQLVQSRQQAEIVDLYLLRAGFQIASRMEMEDHRSLL